MSSGQPRSLLFPGVLILVIVLGLSLVVYARNDRQKDDTSGVLLLGDHIHQAIALNVCGEFLPNLPQFESTIGIHTHADGVIHIHPFSRPRRGGQRHPRLLLQGRARRGAGPGRQPEQLQARLPRRELRGG